MTQKQKQAMLAEAVGWKPDKRGLGWLSPHGYYDTPPDYFNDLNAVHELEKVLTEEQRRSYCDFTYDIACSIQKETGKWNWISLPAAQRAEALGLTLNLWKQ
jgi:hypothetical protein